MSYHKGEKRNFSCRLFSNRQRGLKGENLWNWGYNVSSFGFEEAKVCAYIQKQEQLDSKDSLRKLIFDSF